MIAATPIREAVSARGRWCAVALALLCHALCGAASGAETSTLGLAEEAAFRAAEIGRAHV